MDTSHLNSNAGLPKRGAPVTEADLHAFVDAQLSADRQREVESFLNTHPVEQERVAQWQAQNRLLQQYLDPVLDEALPLRLPIKPRAQAWQWRSLAAGVAIAAISAGSAWWLRGLADGGTPSQIASLPSFSVAASQPQRLQAFARRAVVAHEVYSPDLGRPVEVGGDQEQALVKWLTKRMGSTIRPPDLHSVGYELIGGRLLPGDNGPAAQFMFGDAKGQRLTLYVARENAERETSFHFGQDGAVNVFYWVDKDFGYAISAGADRKTLLRVAETVYRQLQVR